MFFSSLFFNLVFNYNVSSESMVSFQRIFFTVIVRVKKRFVWFIDLRKTFNLSKRENILKGKYLDICILQG